jgi:type II secretory pathway pseudopilin PulG
MFKRMRSNEEGYTLVEMLIVIALMIVLIAITMPYLAKKIPAWFAQATAGQVGKNLNEMKQAAIIFSASPANNGAQATALTGGATTLVGGGALDSVPFSPIGIGAYTWDSSKDYGWGTTANDAVITATTTSTECCSQFNTAYTGAAVGATPPAAIDTTKTIQCYGAAGAFTMIIPVYIN